MNNKEKTDLEFVQSYEAVKEMLQNVKIMSSKQKKEEKIKKEMPKEEEREEEEKEEEKEEEEEGEIEEEKDADFVKSNAEKISIGLEVLADIRSMCKKNYPEIEGYTIVFEKEEDEGKEKLKENIKKGRVCLGDELSYRSTYEFYTNQILGIFARRILSVRENNVDKNKENVLESMISSFKEYMEDLGIKGAKYEFLKTIIEDY